MGLKVIASSLVVLSLTFSSSAFAQAESPAPTRPWLGPYASLITPKKHVRNCAEAAECPPIDEVFYACMASGNSYSRYVSRTRSYSPLAAAKVEQIVATIVLEDDFCIRRSGEGDVNLRRIVDGWENRIPRPSKN